MLDSLYKYMGLIAFHKYVRLAASSVHELDAPSLCATFIFEEDERQNTIGDILGLPNVKKIMSP